MLVAMTKRWFGLVGLLVAEAMNLLDSTITQVVSPVIHHDLGGPISAVQWFSTAYTLPFALLLITGGRVGDLAGRRRVFRVGVVVFALASTACVLAPSTGFLIGCRVVQGAAAAAIIPQTIGLIKAMFSGPDMAKALGTIGPVMGLAAISGPLVGGALAHASSWRAAFLVNVPLSALVLAVTPLLDEDRAPHRPRLDPAGTALVIAGVALIVYPLTRLGTTTLGPPGWVSIGAGLGLTVLFGLHQRARDRRGDGPLIEVSLFRTPVFPAALATSTLFFAVTTGLTLVIVLHAQLGQGEGVLSASLTLLPWTLGMAAASYVSGAFLVGRFGDRLMAFGLGIAILGVLGASVRGDAVLVAVTGVGVGLFTTAFFTAALHVVGPREAGSAAGLLNAVQQLGATLGVAVLGSIYLRTGRASSAFLAAALLLAAASAGALVMVRRSARQHSTKQHRLPSGALTQADTTGYVTDIDPADTESRAQ
jgi:MFS family permease